MCVCVCISNQQQLQREGEREKTTNVPGYFQFFFVAVQIQIVLNHVLFFHSDGNFMLNQSKKSVVIQSYSLEKREKEKESFGQQ